MAHHLTPRERRSSARTAAEEHDGVLNRARLRELGVDRNMVGREIGAERWASHGNQTIAMHTGALSDIARRWRAVWEVGADVAALDGVTALQHAGMTGFDEETIHLSVKHTVEVEGVDGVHVHKVIRRVESELVGAGIPRTLPAVAAVRAAHWAVSDRQAALLLVMPVQQRLCTGAHLIEAVSLIPGRNRRKFIHVVSHDIADGAHSLGELDFVAACRKRGLPEPTRQQIRRLPHGAAYLDVWWEESALAVEVDGTGHLRGLQMVDDDLRQNAVQLGDDLVLRVGILGWRLTPDRYLDQVCTAYWSRKRRAA
ncbi:MAG TPA: hypothetical protein VLA55_00755 [Ornithinibacter sp.]|nr:hypothetical protein [Ornithinibacter sp.]